MSLSSLRGSQVAVIAAIGALGSMLLFGAAWSAARVLGNQAAPVAVNCEANQQAIVRPTMVNGQAQVNVLCVGAGQQQPVSYVDQYGRPIQMMPANSMGPTAVAYTQPAYGSQPVYVPQATYGTQPVYAPQPVARRPPVAQRTSVTQRQVISERPAVRKRSWQKTAMVIGGSAGTGAGVGGLIGGKKGALIGAALGGGGATIYEAIKR